MKNAESEDALAARLVAATEHWLERGRPLCHQAGRRLPPVTVGLDLRGKAAGQLHLYRDGTLTIRYNLALARLQPDSFIDQTVPHEVAHVITHVCHGRVKPHGPEWRKVMSWFGIDQPARCHDFALPESAGRRQRRWDYRCACREHKLSTTRHNRAQRGMQYICRACGRPLRHAAG